MAFRTSAVTVGTSSASQVLDAQAGDIECEIRTSSAVDFYIGGPDVSASNGLRVENGQFTTRVRPGDELWAISAEAGSVQLRILVRSA